MAKILVLNGPNLNLLGTREPEIYGTLTLADINERPRPPAPGGGGGTVFFYTKNKRVFVYAIQAAHGNVSYIILNAAAFTHYSIAIRDAITAAEVPVIEVHLSNIHQREEFRHTSVIAPVALGQITGLGTESYMAALEAIICRTGDAR